MQLPGLTDAARFWHDDVLVHDTGAGIFEQPPSPLIEVLRAPSRKRRADPQHPRGATERPDRRTGSIGVTAGMPTIDELVHAARPRVRRLGARVLRCAAAATSPSSTSVWRARGTRRSPPPARRWMRPGRARRRLRPGLCARPPARPPRPAGHDRRLLPVLEHRAGGGAGATAAASSGSPSSTGTCTTETARRSASVPARGRARHLVAHAARLVVGRPSADRRARWRRGSATASAKPQRRARPGHRRRGLPTPWSAWSRRSSTRSGPSCCGRLRAGCEPVRSQRPPCASRWTASGDLGADGPRPSPTGTATGGW